MAGEATKRPWIIAVPYSTTLREILNTEMWHIAASVSEPDAALIVRAVNGYDAAVTALEHAVYKSKEIVTCKDGSCQSCKKDAQIVFEQAIAALAALKGDQP